MVVTKIKHKFYTLKQGFIVSKCLILILSLLIVAEAQSGNTNLNAVQPEASSLSKPKNIKQNLANQVDYEQDALQVLALIDQSKQLRTQLPVFVKESNQAISQHHGALPSAYALRLAKALSEAQVIRNDLFKQALSHRGALYRVDNKIDDKTRVNEIVIAMSAAVALFENSKEMHSYFDNNRLLRKKLNEGYPEFGIPQGFYDSSTMRSNNPEYRKTFVDAVHYFTDNKAVIETQIGQSSEATKSLYQHIAQSTILYQIKGSNIFKEIITLPVKTVTEVVDLSDRGLNKIKYTGSKIVGNSMGAVRWRAGKLKNDTVMLQKMLAQLQPGDILLEKTPFTLTDKSIPGHFGHAAIYIGSIDQLRQMKALDLPIVQENLAKITEGRGVVEALRNGVQLNKLQDFMNVDDVAILRPKKLSATDRREAVKLALANLGKKYDFNFDVNTTDTIVCSELVYIVYPQVDFITKNVLGSFAITPDDIAIRAGSAETDPLQLILFSHDGQLVFDNGMDVKLDEKGLALYEKLVKGKSKPGEENQPSLSSPFAGFL